MKNFILGMLVAVALLGAYEYRTIGVKQKFIDKKHEITEIKLTVKVFKNQRELRKAIEKKLPRKHKDKTILGFSVWFRPHDGTCTIYVTEAHRESDFDTWGHELAHCMYGNWHKE